MNKHILIDEGKWDLTEEQIAEALDNNFNCRIKDCGDSFQVVHNLADPDEKPEGPLLQISFTDSKNLFNATDAENQPVVAIWCVEDESGDAHQYLLGAAISPEMIAAACFFAT